MKRHLLTLLCCIIATISAHAQSAASYTFSQSSGTYADLPSPTNIYAFSSSWDDNVSSGWNIGFTFNYCGTGYTTFNVCANGWITFSTIGSNTYTPLSVKTNAIAILGGDLYRSTAGFVSYQTTGSSPNRVCTIQWKDVCHFSSATTGPLNFQIRLYETTNVVEFIYGNFAPTSTSSYTYHVGINGAATSDYNNRATTSNWSSTTAGTANTATCTQSNTIKPSSGLVFTWTPPCVLPAISGSDVCVGATATFSHSTAGGTWSSSNTAVATVNSSRVVTGVSAGTASITYTVASCISIKTINILPVPVATAIASPSVICAGGTTGLNVTATNPGAAYGLSGVTFSPVSFTPTGTLSSATTPTTGSNDDGYYTVSIPFTFSFYGNNYTSCNIGTNGYVMFGGGVTSTYINAIPNAAFPVTLSLFGRDMDLRTTGSITYGTTGTSPNRKFIISYNSVPDYSTGVPETGQIVIYETSGDVEYHITTAQATTHTVGIQNATGTSNLTVPGHNNAATGITNTAYKFSMPMPSVAWASDPTLSSLTIPNPTTSALSATTTYTVTATASNGCKGSATVTVNVSPTPAALTGITTLCQTGTTTLTSTAGGTWSSSNSAIATVATGTSTTGVVTGVSAGSATISYFFGASCYVSQSVTVLPTAAVTGPTSVCPGLTINLANAISGGTWTSSNTGLATVDPSTGVVTGVAAGTPNIIYTLPTTCARFSTITVNPLPALFIGTTTVCRGLNTILTESSTGGVWSSGSTAIATVGSVSATTGVVTGISAGITIITYTLPTSCIMTTSVLVNPLPVPITAPLGACVTDVINPTITLVDGTPLGVWSSSNTSVASIISFSGELTGLVPGTAIITYTLPTSCIATTPITINPLPAPIGGAKVVCANATTYLSNPDIGGVWKSSNTSSATIDAGAGIVTGVAGLSTPTISYTLPTGCLGITTITVNPAPGAFSGSADVCEGSTTVLAVGGGGTWQSANPAIASVTPGPAGGGVIGGIAAGNADVTYTLPVTGCYSVTTITVNPTPAAITGTAGVCYGATVTLNNATSGGAWYSSDSMIASVSGGIVAPTSATGGTVDISYVLATGCNALRQVTVNPLPIVYNLNQPSGFTSYCSGDGGLDLELNASVVGINYQLYNSGLAAGIANGNGGVLSFGRQVDAGTYTVVATDALTGCQSNMTGSPVINIDPLPTIYALGVVGSSRYCDMPGGGVDVILTHSDPGVEYTLFIDGNPGPGAYGTGSILSFGLQTTEGIYTAIATDPVTRCASNMSGSILVGKNPLPAVHNVIASDAGNYCAGTAGVHVGLDYGNTGIRYDLYDGATLVGSAAGANSALDFGVWPAGNYTVVGNNSITGCSNNMIGTAMVTMLPLPTLHNVQVIGSSSYCIGNPGAHVQLSGSDMGIGYQLYDGGALIGDAVPGTAAVLDYGFLPTGNYTIIATDTLSGCSVSMSGSAVVTTFPAIGVYNVSVEAPGSYCAGDAGLHIYLSGSAIGVKYDLRNGGAIVATRPTGTGAALDFGAQPAAGAYVVMATDVNGCSVAMTGTPTVVINTLPSLHDVTVTNGGAYCAGSAGVNIGLNFSDAGISYQLYNGAIPVGGLVTGSNSALDFGTFTATGTYTVKAINSATGCLQTMNGSAVVRMSAMPVAYNITGGGSYCAGSVVGVTVGLINSAVGVNYQLFNGAATGPIVSGTGGAITFGNQIATGLYTIVGTDAVTGCANNMMGSTVITIDPLPIAYTVTGGGTNCAGGTGFKVALSNSTLGIDYQLWNSTSLVATKPGTGSAIDYGIQTAAGTYTVFAKTVISGCSEDMSGSATISYNPLPAVHAVAGTGTYCDGGAGAEVYMATSQPGINYQLYKGVVAVGVPVPGTGAKVSFGNMPAGTYTAIAYDAATGCTMNMSGAATISKNALPAAYTVTGGGTMCAGGTGFHIYLTGSQIGVNYQLYEGGVAKGGTMPGTGSALDLGVMTAGATYTAIATNTATGCVNNMAGSGKIVVNAAPDAFAVTGGGNYCESGAGVAVGLEGSVPGMNYQLYNSATAVGMPVGGTGSVITFGLQKGAGAYTVMATNTATKCMDNMTGSVAVVIDPMVVPAVTVGGTDGKACIGDVVNYTASAVNGGTAPTYLWKVGGLPKATGATFSTIPVIGDVITVEMTGNAYCASAPTATTSVAMDMMPYVMPTATVSVNPGVAICTGTPVTMSAITTQGGTTPGYSWLKNGVFVGASVSYEDIAVKDGDVYVFMLRSNLRCRMSDTVFSDPVVIDVDVAEMPAFTIKSHINPLAVHVGAVDSFTVEFTNKPKGLLTYQWYIMGAMVPGATLPVFIDHNIYDNNVVSCEVRKVGACGNQSATAQTTVHLKNLGTHNVVTMASDVSILPNPNKGEFTVKGTIGIAEDEAVTLEITNMLGQVVYTNKVMTHNSRINEQIVLSNTLANGMYLLNIRTSAGNNVLHVVIGQ